MAEPDLFASEPEPEPAQVFLERLRAFVAPIAHQSDAVIKDVELLNWAKALYAAFGDLDDSGDGLTAAEIEAACSDAGPGSFESRLAVFKSMGLLSPPVDHPYQRRLLFSTTGVAALLVYDRLSQGGGVQEILLLLDQTRQGIVEGVLTREEVETRLATLRRALSISTGELFQLRTRPVEELLAQRRSHPAADRLLSEARTLVETVETRFQELSAAGGHLVTQALRYSAAANDLVERLLHQVTAERDFSMLLPEQYRSAAQYCSMEKLAAVFTRAVFDPPFMRIDPEHLVVTLERRQPREVRRRPPRSHEPIPDEDPIERARARREAARRRRQAEVQLLLRGGDEVDLTERIQKAGWPGAAKLLANLLTAASDPTIPVTVELSVRLLISADSEVSYVTPMRLRRITEGSTDG